jgi:hypothetical protein
VLGTLLAPDSTILTLTRLTTLVSIGYPEDTRIARSAKKKGNSVREGLFRETQFGPAGL